MLLQNVGATKLLFRKNFIALNDCIRKEENEMGEK